jgi:hypothetical protein
VRHGHLPEREIMTGIGPVAVRQPQVRDREAGGGERIRFNPTSLLAYAGARRASSAIPILHLKGTSTGDFEEALGALLGKDAGREEAWIGLSNTLSSRPSGISGVALKAANPLVYSESRRQPAQRRSLRDRSRQGRGRQLTRLCLRPTRCMRKTAR